MMYNFGAERKASDSTLVAEEVAEFANRLRQSFEPHCERAPSEVDNAIATLIQQALADATIIKGNVGQTINDMIARLDEQLGRQLNEILHAEAVQEIESVWLGLHYLICNSETNAVLKIRVMNISKSELRQDLRLYPGLLWHQSSLFKQVYEAEFGRLGGEPYGCLIADYSFSHLPDDIRLLCDISKIAASAHCPFFASADSALLEMDCWAELANAHDVEQMFVTPAYAAWRSLRDAANSRYIGLCLPRVLARLPYGSKTKKVEDFAFEEATDGPAGRSYTWMNAAYPMALNINRAFTEFGLCTSIRGVISGGEVIALPTHAFQTDAGDLDPQCSTEIVISERREAELAKSGLIPLLHKKNNDTTASFGPWSLYRPKEYAAAEKTASDNLSARLPYIFPMSRFAHYLKCMVRDKSGRAQQERKLTAWLQSWINLYIGNDQSQSGQTYQAHKPLSAASVMVIANGANTESYYASFTIMPYCEHGGGHEFSVSLADPW